MLNGPWGKENPSCGVDTRKYLGGNISADGRLTFGSKFLKYLSPSYLLRYRYKSVDSLHYTVIKQLSNHTNFQAIMSKFVDSQVSSPKMSTSSSSSIPNLNAAQEASHSTPLLRIKNHWQSIKKDWGPLMAAKEHLYDEYTFPPGRYAGQGLRK